MSEEKWYLITLGQDKTDAVWFKVLNQKEWDIARKEVVDFFDNKGLSVYWDLNVVSVFPSVEDFLAQFDAAEITVEEKDLLIRLFGGQIRHL